MKAKSDPLMEELHKKYKSKGLNPKPNENLDHWAEKYMLDISNKVSKATRLIHKKVPIEDICKETGLNRESIESLYSKKKKEAEVN